MSHPEIWDGSWLVSHTLTTVKLDRLSLQLGNGY